MRKIISFASVMLLFSFVLSFQKLAAQQKNENLNNPYIEVTAIAEKDIMPDNIYIKITLMERLEGREKINIAEQENDLKEGLKVLKLNNSQLQLLDAQSDFVRFRRAKNQVIARKDYLLIVKNASEANQVFQLLDRLNIYEADIYKTTHSQMDSIAKDVRIEAMKAAKAKAEYMLHAINEKLGRALVVYEIKKDLSNVLTLSNVVSQSSSSGLKEESWGNGAQEIGFQKIKLKIEVYIKYEIKQ